MHILQSCYPWGVVGNSCFTTLLPKANFTKFELMLHVFGSSTCLLKIEMQNIKKLWKFAKFTCIENVYIHLASMPTHDPISTEIFQEFWAHLNDRNDPWNRHLGQKIAELRHDYKFQTWGVKPNVQISRLKLFPLELKSYWKHSHPNKHTNEQTTKQPINQPNQIKSKIWIEIKSNQTQQKQFKSNIPINLQPSCQ